jgi:hypothetical protein
LISATSGSAQEFANIEYLCADWGPAMKPTLKTNEPPQFSDTEKEIYFLKQVTHFTRRKLLLPDLLGGAKTEDIGRGTSIYLCSMKPDGSGKTEVRGLWKNPNYSIDTQDQSTWMDVNEKTRKIALAITFAGNEITGLWTMNLDGSELKRIITPERNEKYLQAINKPSWSPDGQWIVFEEELRGTNPNRFNIAACDALGGRFHRLLEASEKVHYRQPDVSPDGELVVYSKYPNGMPGGRHIWLMNPDGTSVHQLLNDKGGPIGGDFPTWSPDGKRIYVTGAGVVEVATGKTLIRKGPRLLSPNGELLERYSTVVMAHWGKLGLLCSAWGAGITVVDENLNVQQSVAASTTETTKP